MSIDTLHWKSKYDTGVEEIDLQHRAFLSLITRLGRELAETKDPKYRDRLLEEIAKYAVFHFISEENLMMKHNYPGLEQHRQLHRDLINQLSWRRQSLSDSDLLEFLVRWFIHHTVEEDHHIGDFINRSNPEVLPGPG